MSIILGDVPAAVADYIEQNVTIEVSDVTHSTSSVLQPDEDATFTNATEGRHRLRPPGSTLLVPAPAGRASWPAAASNPENAVIMSSPWPILRRLLAADGAGEQAV